MNNKNNTSEYNNVTCNASNSQCHDYSIGTYGLVADFDREGNVRVIIDLVTTCSVGSIDGFTGFSQCNH